MSVQMQTIRADSPEDVQLEEDRRRARDARVGLPETHALKRFDAWVDAVIKALKDDVEEPHGVLVAAAHAFVNNGELPVIYKNSIPFDLELLAGYLGLTMDGLKAKATAEKKTFSIDGFGKPGKYNKNIIDWMNEVNKEGTELPLREDLVARAMVLTGPEILMDLYDRVSLHTWSMLCKYSGKHMAQMKDIVDAARRATHPL